MGLLKFLFITILILWLIRLILRLLLPVIFQKVVSKVQQQANQQYYKQQQQHRAPDGRVRVEYAPPKTKNPSDDAGDFVEYEEVK